MSPDTSPAPAGKPYKRRIIIINRPFQLKFVTILMSCVAVAVLIIALDMFTSLGRYVADSGAASPAAIYHDSWVASAVKVAVYMAGVFLVALSVSHKIAGPMYRFEKSCEAVAKGDLATKAFLRKGDEWNGYRESFNGMVEALHSKVEQDVGRAQVARRLLEEILADPAVPEAAREKARKALAAASAIGGQFKLS
jgi:methyl-accepting chemotaxis protein